jgi:hypothetical protein
MKKNVYNVCIGLVIGAFFPFTLILILWVAYGIVISIALRYFHAGFRLNELELLALLVPWVIMSLFFLAKFNKTMAVGASITATGVMILLLSIVNIPH